MTVNKVTAEEGIKRLEEEFAQAVEVSRAAKRSLKETKAAVKAARKARKRARKALIAAQEAIESPETEVSAKATISERSTTDVDRPNATARVAGREVGRSTQRGSKSVRKTAQRVRRVPLAGSAGGSQASQDESSEKIDSTDEDA